MMRDEQNPDPMVDKVRIDTVYEFYLKGRDDPVQVPSTFEFNKDLLDDGVELSDFQSICVNTALSALDNRWTGRMVFSDRRFNKFVIFTDEVQAVSVLAPDEETILQAMAEGE